MQDRPSPTAASLTPADAAPERDDASLRRPEDQQSPDRWAFNPWRRTRAGTAARRISNAVLAYLAANEKRQRKRKGADSETFADVVDAVVANLLRCQLDASQQGADDDEKRGWVRIPLSARRLKSSSRSRYDVAPIPLLSSPRGGFGIAMIAEFADRRTAE